jgi:hypothetical protein
MENNIIRFYFKINESKDLLKVKKQIFLIVIRLMSKNIIKTIDYTCLIGYHNNDFINNKKTLILEFDNN